MVWSNSKPTSTICILGKYELLYTNSACVQEIKYINKMYVMFTNIDRILSLMSIVDII